MNSSDFSYLGYGAGLRPPHYSFILENKPDIDWFEIISENYMDTDGNPKRMLEKIRAHYPVVMHGVSLSIGTIDPINSLYLQKLKNLAAWVQPAWISDHLCWTGVAHKNSHDLLPVPYTEEALAHLIDRVQRVQDILGRRLVLENPSTYLEFSASGMTEWEFISRLAQSADCGLLLDVNNVYVSCYNHHWNPKTYIDSLPMERVAQIHLAGHSNKGTHIVDTHDGPVIDEVWNLYRYVLQRANRPISSMIEWDDDIPAFSVVMEEVSKARAMAQRTEGNISLPSFAPYLKNTYGASVSYAEQLHRMQNAIFEGNVDTAEADQWIVAKPDFPPIDQLRVYMNGYRYRLFDIIYEDYPGMKNYLGTDVFSDLINQYIEKAVPHDFNISKYAHQFPDFVKGKCDAFACEMAVLETAVSRLFDAPETSPLSHDDLAGLTAEKLMETRLAGRKAMELHCFFWPVNRYLTSVLQEGAIPKKPEKEMSFVAVYRHEGLMWRLELEETEYRLLSALLRGLTVSQAMESVQISDQDAARVQSWFTRWMSNSLFAASDASLAQKEAV